MKIIKKFKEMEKGIKYALLIFFVLVLADIVSTLMSWELLEYLEANPIFKYGGIPLVFLLNILIMYLFYYMYSKTDNISNRFYLMLILVSVMTTRVLVIFQNVQIAMNPPTIAELQSVGAQVLAQAKRDYMWRLMMINMLPYINGVITWMLFKKDHEVKRWKKMKKKKKLNLKKWMEEALQEFKNLLVR